MRRAFGYCRVSLESQVDGFSLDNQKRVIEAICTAEGFELVATFVEEGVSGSIPLSQRPQGAALVAAVKPGDLIVSLKLDRMFRSVADASATLADLQRRNVGLYLKDLGGDVTSSSVSALVFNLLAAVATFERERIAERTSEGMRASCAKRRAAGRLLGGKHIPFGFRKVDRREPDATKPVWYLEPVPALHAEALRLKTEGVSLRRAADAFRGQGHNVSHCGVAALYRTV